MYLVSTQVGHPELRAWKYPLPGDSVVTMIQRVIIDVSGATRRAWFASRCRPTSTAPRSATTSPAAAASGPTSSGIPTARTSRSCRRRATTSTKYCASPTPSTGAIRDVLEETVDDAVRVRQRPRELARAAGVERSDLVLRARQLGPALPLRSHDRKAQAADHDRRRQRHAARCASTRRRARSTSAASARRRGAIRTSAISTRSGWTARASTLLTPENADHDVVALAVGQVLRRHLLDARRRRRRPWCATRTASCSSRSRRPTSRASSPRGGSRPSRSPSRRATARRTSTA